MEEAELARLAKVAGQIPACMHLDDLCGIFLADLVGLKAVAGNEETKRKAKIQEQATFYAFWVCSQLAADVRYKRLAEVNRVIGIRVFPKDAMKDIETTMFVAISAAFGQPNQWDDFLKWLSSP